MEIKRIKYLIIWLLFVGMSVQGQELFYRKNLANIDIEKLTKQDLSRFQRQAAAVNMSESEVISYLMDKGLSRNEISSLLKRMDEQSGFNAKPVEKNISKLLDQQIENDDPLIRRMYLKSDTPPDSMMFGSELFSNSALQFAPNLQLATPVNYVLGPGDQINLTVYGNQEVVTDQLISPNGKITLPYAGVVHLGGLTVEQAEDKIKKILVNQGFESLITGGTRLTISVSNYRTIPVTVIGAKNSGNYLVPSVATAFHALVLAGGPHSRGSYRAIEVVRRGKIIQRIDLYKFLVNGDRSKDVVLEENDVINIPVYDNIVRLRGEVKRKGFFELTENENLDTLLRYAGGFTPIAYKENIYVEKVGTNEFFSLDLKREEFSGYYPSSGDVLIVGSISSKYYNKVIVAGAINRPGNYGWDEGLMLSNLILRAGGLEESALLSRGIVYRSGRNHESVYLRFVPKEVAEGVFDIALKDGDSVVIGDRRSMFPFDFIEVVGEVNQEDKYTFGEGMTALDAILMAGGMKKSAIANRIEIARRIEGTNDRTIAGIIVAQSDAELIVRADEVTLKPRDIVIVKPNPDFQDHQIVTFEGEVKFPGSYALLRKNERLSSLLTRAGGLTALGDQNGVVIIRKKSNPVLNKELKKIKFDENEASASLDSLLMLNTSAKVRNKLQNNEENNFGDESFDDMDYFQKNPKSETGNKKKTGYDKAKKEQEEFQEEPTYIAINNIVELLKKPGGKYDLQLHHGDKIIVFMRDNTVSVRGMVNNQVTVNFMGKRLKKYIRESGGTLKNAQKSRIFVIEPNGRAQMTKSFLGIKSYPFVNPGSAVVVPAKPKKDSRLSDPASMAAVASVLASVTGLIFILSTK